ncbi:hypothetical protein LTR62_001712 [Meristemomyces frigidus]|uniref:BHLH domain-containing protein n=1 Tax=Meristemomyces frigidus TaxID=1508187 RepID=A0AAN7YM86_9PEZI|nr:hypothetical protein LTR62_001712 [Meristemomyces frigidus]
MTALLSAIFPPSMLATALTEVVVMPDNSDRDWRYPQPQPQQPQQQQQQQQQQHIQHCPPITTEHWSHAYTTAPLGGMASVDLRMFHEQQYSYTESYGTTAPHAGPPSAYNNYYDEPNLQVDTEMLTPSTATFSTDMVEDYQPCHDCTTNFLHPPLSCAHTSISAQSPHSVERETPLRLQPPKPLVLKQQSKERRPTYSRAATAPEPRLTIKRSGSDDGEADEPEEDDYAPTITEPKNGRGRKRQRIPHTAVERRYRENLNAHLERLRRSVPALAFRPATASNPSTNGGTTNTKLSTSTSALTATTTTTTTTAAAAATGLGYEEASGGINPKPSKCEILSGAIDFISALERENRTLRNENEGLRKKGEELERWCGGGGRGNNT